MTLAGVVLPHPRATLSISTVTAGGEPMKRIAIKVPAVNADILEIGEDCANLGHPNYIIEKISEPFTDDKGWKMVEVTIIERPST